MKSANHIALSIDLKPFSLTEKMVLTLGVRALTHTTLAHRGKPFVEVHSAVINRGNYNPPFAIRKAVLPVSDKSNKPVVE
jgi:hypothetical protein